jgi:TM2 domain-containing membrane protein YozV
MKSCPYCAEEIQDAAVVCKHCGRDLKTGASGRTPTWNPGVAMLLSVVPGLGHLYKGQLGQGVLFFLGALVGYSLFIVPGLFVHLFAFATAYTSPSAADREAARRAKRQAAKAS